MNLANKTQGSVRISIKGNFLIKIFEVLSVFYKLVSSRFIGLVESFNPKNKHPLKEVIKILKIGIEFIQSKQQRHMLILLFTTFDQM